MRTEGAGWLWLVSFDPMIGGLVMVRLAGVPQVALAARAEQQRGRETCGR